MKPYRLVTSWPVSDIILIELQKRYCFFFFKTIDHETVQAYAPKKWFQVMRQDLLDRNGIADEDYSIIVLKRFGI